VVIKKSGYLRGGFKFRGDEVKRSRFQGDMYRGDEQSAACTKNDLQCWVGVSARRKHDAAANVEIGDPVDSAIPIDNALTRGIMLPRDTDGVKLVRDFIGPIRVPIAHPFIKLERSARPGSMPNAGFLELESSERQNLSRVSL
jgi:hypothetical protein